MKLITKKCKQGCLGACTNRVTVTLPTKDTFHKIKQQNSRREAVVQIDTTLATRQKAPGNWTLATSGGWDASTKSRNCQRSKIQDAKDLLWGLKIHMLRNAPPKKRGECYLWRRKRQELDKKNFKKNLSLSPKVCLMAVFLPALRRLCSFRIWNFTILLLLRSCFGSGTLIWVHGTFPPQKPFHKYPLLKVYQPKRSIGKFCFCVYTYPFSENSLS